VGGVVGGGVGVFGHFFLYFYLISMALEFVSGSFEWMEGL
jgi:hypothetical protein